MSTKADAVLFVPGKLTFKGTDLGPIKDSVFIPNIKTGLITAEEYGHHPVDHINIGSSAVFKCILRSENSFSNLFPSTAPYVNTGSGQPGKSLAAKAGELVYVPDSATHPGVIIYNAVPLVDDRSMISFGWSIEWGLPVFWHAIPDSTGRTWAWT